MSRLTSITSAPTYRYIQAAMLVVLVIAFGTSFESGSEGARLLGFPTDFVSSLPLVCDVVAGVATVIHGRVRSDAKMRRLASQFVLGPMLLSWGANSVDHVQRATTPAHMPTYAAWGDWQQGLWIGAVVLAAGICPVAVAALLHLSTKYVDFEQRQSEKAEKRNNTVAAAAAAQKPRPSAPAVTAPSPTPEIEAAPAAKPAPKPESEVTSLDQPRNRRAAGIAWARENWPVSGGAIATEIGVSKGEGDRIRAMVKKEMEQAS